SAQAGNEEDEDDIAPLDDLRYHNRVERDDLADESVNRVEKDAHYAGGTPFRPEKQSGERGRKSERVEGRDGDRERDCQRELLVENAGRSREEADRHEHRDEHERRGYD